MVAVAAGAQWPPEATRLVAGSWIGATLARAVTAIPTEAQPSAATTARRDVVRIGHPSEFGHVTRTLHTCFRLSPEPHPARQFRRGRFMHRRAGRGSSGRGRRGSDDAG